MCILVRIFSLTSDGDGNFHCSPMGPSPYYLGTGQDLHFPPPAVQQNHGTGLVNELQTEVVCATCFCCEIPQSSLVKDIESQQ